MDRSYSESTLNELNPERTPPNIFVSQRFKKRRDEGESNHSALMEDIKTMIADLLAPQRKELSMINSNLHEIKTVNQKIEQSMDFLAKQNEELQKKITVLETQAKKDREHINMLEDKMEEIQRSSRKTCLEIKNVPSRRMETKDDLINLVTSLSKSVNCIIEKSDIKDIFRIQGRKSEERNTPIIVETSSTLTKNDFLKSCKSFNIKNKEKLRAKHLGLTINEDTPVFVSEYLTVKGARLYFLARDLSKTKHYKFCWTSFGKVYMRKDENSPVIIIKSESQVHHLMQEI